MNLLQNNQIVKYLLDLYKKNYKDNPKYQSKEKDILYSSINTLDKSNDVYWRKDELFINNLYYIRQNLLAIALDDCFSTAINESDIVEFQNADNSILNIKNPQRLDLYNKKHIIYENYIEARLNQEIKFKPNSDTIGKSIGKLLFYLGGKGWSTAVMSMAIWYENNVDSYQSGIDNKHAISRRAYNCPLINGLVYDDCSSFVFACLLNYGLKWKGTVPSSSEFTQTSYTTLAKEMSNLGFTPIAYSKDILEPFDILAVNGSKGNHVEIFAGEDNNGNLISYGWGNNNNKLRGRSVLHNFVKYDYDVIWRSKSVNSGLINVVLGNYDGDDMKIENGNYTGTVKVGVLTDELKNTFISVAKTYNIDWKWLAALSWVESKWNPNVGNSMGYSFKGLFQFNAKNMPNGLNVNNYVDQTKAAAMNIANNMKTALKNGFSTRDSYLYAGICHNAGPGGAKWALNNAPEKTIDGIRAAFLGADGGYGRHGRKVGWFKKSMTDKEADRQSREKADYAIKLSNAYNSIT